MRKNISYSIWIMPDGKAKSRLSKIILKLSERYKSPKFKPHVTLIGGFTGEEKNLLAKTKKLSKSIKKFKIKLTKTAYLNEFFRALFILVRKDGTLAKNHEIAIKEFTLPKNKKYLPHLSLIYGNFSKKTKEDVIKNTGRVFNMKFEARSIYLVHCNEKDMEWTIIKKFPLKDY